MSRARNDATDTTPAVLSRFCAACLVFLAIFPFTAPFGVCHLHQAIGADTQAHWPPSRGNAFEAWALLGGELGDEKTMPMAKTIAETSSAQAAVIHPAVALPDCTAPPIVPDATSGESSVLVLRV
jgi:hypothetical protein